MGNFQGRKKPLRKATAYSRDPGLIRVGETWHETGDWVPEIPLMEWMCAAKGNCFKHLLSHRIHVWYIYLHLVDFYGKCR